MSDLKKTLRDMEKTEVGEYRHGRGHFPTEDDGGRANVEVLQALCPNPGATALESVVWAADQIESLQQFRRDAKVENAELHAKIESLQRENEELRGDLEIARLQRDAKRWSAAITPEMRERIVEVIELARQWVPDHVWAEMKPVRDLLGEQG